MSGGHFDYKDQYAKDEIFGWGNKPSNVFEDREISELVWDVFNLIHDYDWYASGDTSEGNWNKSKKDFKGKWLTQEGQKARFSKYIDDAVAELKSDLGLLSEAFCPNCGASEHLYGAEYPKRKVVCDKCGQVNVYPWEQILEDGEYVKGKDV